jgi:hypothetical protein
MTEHKCHCKAPATWMLRIVPTREVVLTEGHLPQVILGARGVATWAACDDHLAEAGRSLIEGNSMEDAVLVLRPEGE